MGFLRSLILGSIITSHMLFCIHFPSKQKHKQDSHHVNRGGIVNRGLRFKELGV